jgi:hypothetical protein
MHKRAAPADQPDRHDRCDAKAVAENSVGGRGESDRVCCTEEIHLTAAKIPGGS